MLKKLSVLFLFILTSIPSFSQVDPQTQLYRDEPRGDKTFRKKGMLDGNLIRAVFRNDGQIGDWVSNAQVLSLEWPKGTGHNYIDGCTPLVTTTVVAPGNGQVIHPVQTSYREEIDKDPVTQQNWVVEPVPGYALPGSEEPALSTKPFTWPEQWPRSLPNITPEWDGFWFGYFGRGVQNADVETFYVSDDSQDREFTRAPWSYWPIAGDNTRGGLGLRIETRGFQWSHVLAEDIIFWHFDIVNISDTDLDSTLFGYYCDTGVGGGYNDGGDDNASYNTFLDIAYAFDNDGIAPPNSWETGYIGYAYLESPGNSFNGINDDEDTDIFGVPMIDEKRDDGIDNDKDWVGYIDLNGNGVWDSAENEPLNNDVGSDGVGPFDPQYNGPDQGEGDGVPTSGEPNFDATDKDESDQIGLTSLTIDRIENKGPLSIWPKNDDYVWTQMFNHVFDTTIRATNIQILFGSGPFPLKKNKRERFSVALVMGSNEEDMIFNKETVQQIYNANYNFAKPPYKATLKAVGGDKKVFLYWDDLSEESRDPFLGYEDNDPTKGYKKDFEGYLIYKSEEPEFNDIKLITDSKGEPKYWKPIAQFDLVDSIKGPDPVGINGAHFWRGDDRGLQHSYIDSNVVNGKQYYYALVAYDQGDPNFGTKGLIPSETTKIISEDVSGSIKFVDINCAVVIPNAPAAGYIPPEINGDLTKVADGLGTGRINAVVLSQGEVINGTNYKVVFESSSEIPVYKTTSYSIIKEVNGVSDTVFGRIDSSDFGRDKFSPPFDGLSISVLNADSVSVDVDNTGWLSGFSTINMPVIPDERSPLNSIAWPSDYEIEWFAENIDTTLFNHIPIRFKTMNITYGYEVEVEIDDNDHNGSLTIGDEIVILEYFNNQPKFTWEIGYYEPIIPITAHPEEGDIFIVKTNRPFKTGDYFTFSTNSSKVDNNLAKDELDKIGVVPNPYITTASWESRLINQTGRGERRIDFINLPAKCTVRIFTVSGALVKTLFKDSSPTDGTLSWNLVSEDGMDIAYGLYIFHVDAPGIGEKIGKFAIIK